MGAVPASLSVYQQLQYLSRVYPASLSAHPYNSLNLNSLVAMATPASGSSMQPSPSLRPSPSDLSHPLVNKDTHGGCDDNWDDYEDKDLRGKAVDDTDDRKVEKVTRGSSVNSDPKREAHPCSVEPLSLIHI